MANIASSTKFSITRLIMWPAIITLVVTLLRLAGELLHGPAFLFSRSSGGGGAIVGISWLPFILGPYFAVKVYDRSRGPSGFGKTILFALAGFVVLACGAVVALFPPIQFTGHVVVGLALMVGAAALQYIPWKELAQTLIAYGYLARVPVVIVMFFAMQGHWQTHYSAVPEEFGQLAFWPKFLYLAVAPQLVMWVVYTMTVGALFGGIYAAVVRRK